MKKMNPNKIRIAFSFSIAFVVIVVTTIFFGILMKKINTEIKDSIIENHINMTKAYSQSINYLLRNYYNSLELFSDPKIYDNNSVEQIHDFIKNNKRLNHPDFFNVCFITLEGISYNQTGDILDFSDRDFFKKALNKNITTYAGSAIPSKITNDYVFTVTKKAKNSNGDTVGLISAGITLTTLNKIIENIKIEKQGKIFIFDEKGRIIANKDKDNIYQNSIILQNILNSFSESDNDLLNQYECLHHYDEKQNVFYFINKIKDTDWTIGLLSPAKHIYKINIRQQKAQIIVVLITISAIILTLIIEFLMMNYFQKKQMLSTLFDPLTNLWSKSHFEQEATKLLRQNKNNKFMLIESDIRGFKFINQNFGEDEADKLLIFFSSILKRYTIENNGIIGRGFADHFYILVKVDSVHNSMNQFKKYIEKINEDIKQNEITFFPKFGISFLMGKKNSKASTVQSLIGQASFAKSIIKDNILTQYSIYNSKLLDKINEERYIEQHMNTALENNEFFVMYQPKIELLTDKIVGAEALVRWKNPKLGFLTPDKFIPLFERNGFIKKLDYYVYEQVFIFLQKRIDNDLPVIPISINMSRNHSKPDKFLRDFMQIFNKYTIPPHLIEIEIIERSVMDNNTLREITELLHKEGFSVAMDDFGSGESSLNMLTKIPVDVLKFDRTFLQSSLDENGNMDKESADFIETLVDLSKHLKKQTVFEGVETKEQRDFLKSIECDQVQGYFYSKPLSEPDFVAFMSSRDIFVK